MARDGVDDGIERAGRPWIEVELGSGAAAMARAVKPYLEANPINVDVASGDCSWFWLAARYDDVIYRCDARNADVAWVKVSAEPHGLTAWLQPRRCSPAHTTTLR